jgi:predicted DNA-binding transcriptional regulator YafY
VRAERLLRIMFLLRAHGRLTARDLATRLEVSTRTVARDLTSLSVAGVPVYAERGRGGGWVLAPDYRTRLDGLTPAESMAVFLGPAGHVLADLGLRAAADSAYTKLLTTVPAHARRQAEHARDRILVDHTGWHPSNASRDHLDVLQAALWSNRRLRLRYRDRDRDRTVEPLGLVAKGNHWYLVAAAGAEGTGGGEPRTYRVSRIEHATMTGEEFIRPTGFDLAAYWDRSRERYLASLRDYPVVLWVRDTARHRLALAPNAEIKEVVTGPGGWSRVRARFEKAYETRAFLLGLAGDVVIVAPAELRDAMITAARTLLGQHPGEPGSASRPADNGIPCENG